MDRAGADFLNVVKQIKEMLGGDGEGSILGKITGFVDKDGDGNPINDIMGMFGKK